MIKKLIIKEFGPIKCVELDFSEGINFVFGRNASGKTHILYSILYLYQSKEVLYIPEDYTDDLFISITYKYNSREYTVEKRLVSGNESIGFNNLAEASLSIEHINPNHIQFISCERLYRNSRLSKSNIEAIKKRLNSLDVDEEIRSNVFNRFRIDEILSQDGGSIISMGSAIVLNLLVQLSLTSAEIIVIDAAFSMIDIQMIDELVTIIEAMNFRQTIFLESSLHDLMDIRNYNVIEFENNNSPGRRVGCNYNYKFPIVKVKHDSSNELIISNFIYNDIASIEENINYEFKEVKGNNPTNSIIKVAGIYIVAYLNSLETKQGSIFWGITDDRRVVGVELDYNLKDEIQRKICESIGQIEPHVGENLYSILFHNVYENDKPINNLYIIEIQIRNISNTEFLYCTPKSEVYIKTQGGKRKLSLLEVQQELKNRIVNDYVR